MTSIDGISNPGISAALQIAQQNQKSKISATPDAGSSTNDVLGKLNAMYGSDGVNKAANAKQLEGVAGLLGVDTETLTSGLQGKNAAKVNELISQASLLKSMNAADSGSSSGSLFDSKF